jgi:hypothetical protein
MTNNCRKLNRKTSHNSGLAKLAVLRSAERFVVNQSLVLRINPPAGGWWKSPPSPSPKTLTAISKAIQYLTN